MKYVLYLFITVFTQFAIQAQDRQAYIEYDKVVQSIAVYNHTRSEIAVFKQSLNDSLDLMLREYDAMMRKSAARKTSMCPVRTRKLAHKLQRIEEKIKMFQAYAMQEMHQEQRNMKHTLKRKIDVGVKKYCNEYDISIMVDKSAVLFCDDCVNHTKQLIHYLRNDNENWINKI